MRKMFSKPQIEEMVDQGAKATILGELQDPTSDIYHAVYEDAEVIDLEDYIQTGFAKSNTMYAKLIIKRDSLQIILSGAFVAGASAGNNPYILGNFGGLLSNDIKDKIYRMDGTKLIESYSSLSYVAFTGAPKRVGSSLTNTGMCALNSPAINELTILGFSFGTIAEDTVCQIDIRFSLNL